MGFKENLLHLKESLLQTDICNPYTFTGWEHKHRSRWWSMSLTGRSMLSTGSKTSAQWNEGAETFIRKQVNECWLRLHWDKGKFPSVFGFCETFFPQHIEFIMYEHCSNSQSVKNWTSFFLNYHTFKQSPENNALCKPLFPSRYVNFLLYDSIATAIRKITDTQKLLLVTKHGFTISNQ